MPNWPVLTEIKTELGISLLFMYYFLYLNWTINVRSLKHQTLVVKEIHSALGGWIDTLT